MRMRLVTCTSGSAAVIRDREASIDEIKAQAELDAKNAKQEIDALATEVGVQAALVQERTQAIEVGHAQATCSLPPAP